MQKLIRLLTAVFLFLLFLSALPNLKPVNAQCVCSSWVTSSYTCEPPQVPYAGWCTTAVCYEYTPPCTVQCGPGYYECNRSGGCCPIGLSPTDNTGGGGCSSAPAAVSGLSPSGTTACGLTSMNFSWNGSAGSTGYLLRIDDTSNGWTGSCSSVNPGDSCLTVAGTSYSRSVTPGHSYNWWVAAQNTCGASASVSTNVGVPACVTPPPACAVSSAVLSPASANILVGSSANFSLTVSDSPAGCTDEANFVRSNANASILSTNPDPSTPYTVTVQCDVAGTVNLTGQAMSGGLVKASDTSAITCTAVPIQPPTPTSFAGQCTQPSMSGSGSCSAGNLNLSYSWGAVAGAATYRRQVSTSSTFSTLLVNTTGSGTSFTTTQAPGTYYARVRVETTSGSCTAPSNWGNTVNVSNGCGTSPTPVGFASPTNTPTPRPTATPTPPPAQINIPSVTITGIGSTQTITVSVISGTIINVNFDTNNPLVATVNPTFDGSSSFQTTITSTGVGNTTYTADALDSNGNIVSDTATIRVLNPLPWCQVGTGDLVTVRDVVCPIPSVCTLPSCTPAVSIGGNNQPPGLVVAGTFLDDGPGGNTSPPVAPYMSVVSDPYRGPTYDYNYFYNKAGAASISNIGSVTLANLLGASTYDGYHWARISTCPATVPVGGIDLTTNKVVLFVDCSDFNIDGPINLTNGQGFFLVIARGNINVNGNVGGPADTTPDIKGLYFAGDFFNSESPDVPTDQQLHVRGTMIARDFNLFRNLPNNSFIPAEYFEYAPDLVMQFPPILSRKQVIWREVAP